MNSPYVVALEGIPGSGKTTLRNTISIDGCRIDRVEQILPDDPDTDDDLSLDQIVASDILKTGRATTDGHDIVLLDRYYLSTLAYQFSYDVVNAASTYEDLDSKYKSYLENGDLIVPDVTFYIDTPLKESYVRKNRLSGDKMWVNDQFLNLNRTFYKSQQGLYTIDGKRSLSEIKLEIENIIKKGVIGE